MTLANFTRTSTALGVLLCLAGVAPAHAAPLIANGGFESGLTGWTTLNAVGSLGSFVAQSGTTSPVLGDPVPAPPGGTQAAMTDADGPGSHLLYQDFLVPVGTASGTLSFDVFVGNRADRFVTPGTLAFNTAALNQQARVDILGVGADPFSVALGDLLLNAFLTNVGDPLVSGYSTVTVNVSSLLAANAGQTLRLRFAEVDNVGPFQFGVDNVSLEGLETQPVPEPASLMLVGSGLAALALRRRRRSRGAKGRAVFPALLALAAFGGQPAPARADTTPPALVDPNLQVATVLNTGLTQPIGIVFLGSANDFLVLEKASGQIKRVRGGVIQETPVLDLAVNSNSERGLLSLALHPDFPETAFMYVRWTESSTGADSTVNSEVPLLGNRIDRFVWNGSTLTMDQNIIMLRARQTDNQPVPGHEDFARNNNENGNHNGGVIRFGPDGKLYVYMGDQGRRGWMQNLPNGPFLTPPFTDDTFGGPMPDNAHLSGVVLRLNDDGSAPSDNPFFQAGATMGGEVGGNIQKIFSYGHRNSFGMAFDPVSDSLWLTENADDAFSELNRVIPGMNGGWIQVNGPLSRFSTFKLIETTQFNSAMQQARYPPTRVAYTAARALAQMHMLPGATYVDPDFSWRYEVGPAGTAFVEGTALGPGYEGTLWIGSARSNAQVGGTGGSLYLFRLTPDRLHVDVSGDPLLADRVADNLFRPQKFDGTESESLIIGTGFGTTPDIVQGPDGNLYVVSVTDNAIYRISLGNPQ